MATRAVLIFLVILAIVFGTEVLAYLWHRYAAHPIPSFPLNLVSPVTYPIRKTHELHHNGDETHEAHEDFFWVILFLLILGLGIFLVWSYQLSPLPVIYLILGYGLVCLVFIWNWYIHSAYHIRDHWLNRYHWFRKDREIHFQHHADPEVNYGIASHFSDIIGGTYKNPGVDIPFSD